MDAQPNLARQVWDRLRARFSRKAVAALGIIALLGICDTAIAHSMPSPYAQPSPTATVSHPAARRATSRVARLITPVAGQPVATETVATAPTAVPTVAQNAGVQATPTVVEQPAASDAATTPPVAATAKPKPRPKRKATPATKEAQTPVHLTDPLSNDALASDTPWWQSALDVSWKLALVVALIYLATRALAALKGRGFASGKGLIPRPGKSSSHFMEQIEEIQLAPNHVLHAVRVGERVMLIARTNGTLRALGEAEMAEEGGTGEAPALPAGNFTGQLMRAWAGLIPGAVKEDATQQDASPEVEPGDENPADAEDDEVIDAKWSPIQPDAVTEDATLPELPLRKGTARPSDAPEPLSPEQEREILWFAEANGDGAAAKKFGLTRQRVTAMRVRHDRMREERARDKRPALARPATPDAVAAPADAPRPEPRPALPDLPRHNPAKEPALPAAARGSLARSAYRQGAAASPAPKPAATPVKPDVAATPKPAEEAANDAQSITVGQILAARFGIKIPPQN